MYSHNLLLIIILFYFLGCSNGEKIEEDKLIKVYTDMVFAQDTLGTDNDKFISKKNEIFKKYGITEKDYRKTLDFYSDDITRWDVFFDKVISHMESMQKKEEN